MSGFLGACPLYLFLRMYTTLKAMKHAPDIICLMLFLAAPAAARAQFIYTTNGDAITITGSTVLAAL